MQKLITAVFALSIIVIPIYSQTTGSVIDRNVESVGKANGASKQEIGELQQHLQNTIPKNVLEGSWKVVSDFNTLHVKNMSLDKPEKKVTILVSPQLADYIDTSGPEGFGGSLRTYAFFIGRGFTGTLAAYLERYIGPVEIKYSNDIPSQGLVIAPSLSGFSYKFVPKDIRQTIKLNINLNLATYLNGRIINSKDYSLSKHKGPKPFIAVNSGSVDKNMVLIMSDLVSNTMSDIHSTVIANLGSDIQIFDMDKVILASLTWEDYNRMKMDLTPQERGLASYFLAIDKAYKDSNTDRQAELLKKMQVYVKDNSIESSSRKQLLDEIRTRYAMRETQQKVRNEIEDSFFNFAGEHTETVLTVAEIAPDIAKVGLLVAASTNPLTLTAMLAAMESFEHIETGAKFTGEASAEYFFGSGEVSKSLWAGSKAVLLDAAGGKAGDLVGSAAVNKAAARQASDMSSAAVKSYSDDVARYTSARVYGNSMEKFIEPGKSAAQLFTKPGAAFSAEEIEKQIKNITMIKSKSIHAAGNPDSLLPENCKMIAGGIK